MWPFNWRIIFGFLAGVTGMTAFAATPAKPSTSTAAKPAGTTIDFNRDIRTILSDNCFACHGPDENKRKAKLRFDIKEEAFKAAKSGDYAIVPGDLKKSQLIARITAA